MSPFEQVLAFMMSLAGDRNHVERSRYAQAIVATDADPMERAVLTVVAYRENWFHERSYPPFGLTYYVSTHPGVCWSIRPGHERWDRSACVPLSIEDGARRSLHVLRWIRTTRCRTSDWSVTYGWYRTGRCRADRLSRINVALARRVVAAWRHSDVR